MRGMSSLANACVLISSCRPILLLNPKILSVHQAHKGTLELGFTIVVPPGRLGQYTKVVQFWPRLVVVNRLQRDLVLEQNSPLRYAFPARP